MDQICFQELAAEILLSTLKKAKANYALLGLNLLQQVRNCGKIKMDVKQLTFQDAVLSNCWHSLFALNSISFFNEISSFLRKVKRESSEVSKNK